MGYYDTYYCPNCGAVLNDQSGFDPDEGTRRCTECGTFLMDDDIYDGNSFSGVAWFCDECGALLNRQPGFSDNNDSWVCTVCGHRNGITEDDILLDSKYTCPECGAALDHQTGFSEYDDEWVCEKCNAHLLKEYNEYEALRYPNDRCPNCGAYLEKQSFYYSGEKDWECQKCGSNLHRDYSLDDFEIVYESDPIKEKESDNDEDADNKYTYSGKGSFNFSHYESNASDKVDSDYKSWKDVFTKIIDDIPKSYTLSESQKEAQKQAIKEGLPVLWKLLGVILVIFLIIGLTVCGYIFKKTRTFIGRDSNSFIGQDYLDAEEYLKLKGFKKITTNEISDLSVEDILQANKVTEINIGGTSEFNEKKICTFRSNIVITFHSLKFVDVPFSHKDVKGKSYIDIEKELRDAGFSNIRFEKDYSIITGWVNKDGDVKSVLVNGDEKYDAGDPYRVNAEIVITYYTLKKSKDE